VWVGGGIQQGQQAVGEQERRDGVDQLDFQQLDRVDLSQP
jgi:hypothetical protein